MSISTEDTNSQIYGQIIVSALIPADLSTLLQFRGPYEAMASPCEIGVHLTGTAFPRSECPL